LIHFTFPNFCFLLWFPAFLFLLSRFLFSAFSQRHFVPVNSQAQFRLARNLRRGG